MSNAEALGIMEVVGLPAAIECADAAVKAANVRLIGYELTKGVGWVTVKVAGNIGAVQSAIAAGTVAASRITSVVGVLLLPRPHEEIKEMIYSPDNVYYQKTTKPEKGAVAEEPEVVAEILSEKTHAIETEIVEIVEVEPVLIDLSDKPEPVNAISSSDSKPATRKATCNLCGDPICPRGKGDPHKDCIHYGEVER
ncbi:Propanediol utilization protein PduA [Pelotomaculum schinkii]|uniref:Propanediol utilization protein PduA n=1 Tax=Pelotomaculum schinkii TaxID=78350 RepID=A0A4Y7R9P5_9FIRM|nr:BMC domain-containing protein [Pelotomaculum schinkii]TEB05413.1 Propanediol utilization protein PduA [Pelotomaculum schinkii]